jgi:tetratricopeptide (TPR) repeat protein
VSSSRPPEEWTRWVWDRLRTPEDPSPDVAEKLLAGRYERGELLGEGGCARVFRGRDQQLGRPVAIKLLRESALRSETARERFRREAQAAGSLSHPNVVTVHDAGEQGGVPFLVLELVEGPDLAGRFAARDVAGRVELLEKIARGVAAAHSRGIVHRDLKPSNILLTPEGEPKVGDFGLATLAEPSVAITRSGIPIGTPLYMAPEQAEGRSDAVSPRTDVYALGVIAYEALTGRPPFHGSSESELYRRIVNEPPPPPRGIPRPLEAVILKALRKEPALRYADAQEFAEDLGRWRQGRPVLARPPSIVERGFTWARRRKQVVAIAVIVAAAVIRTAAVRTSERETSLEAIRRQARLSLEASLALRRAANLSGARSHLSPLQNAYHEAVARAGTLAEPDYLLGRLYRALMENDRALECQNRALSKQPDYGPALYERIVLLSQTQALLVHSRGREAGLVARDDAGKQIRADARTLLALRGSVGEAHLLVVLGVRSLQEGDAGSAKKYVREALEKDSSLEEGWLLLANIQWFEKEPEQVLEASREACDTLLRATALDQGYFPYWRDLAAYTAWEAVNRSNDGEDPMPLFRRAEGYLDRVLALAPDYAPARQAKGELHFHRAADLMKRGRNPVADLDASERELREAIRLQPDYPAAILTLMGTHAYHVIYRVTCRQNPSEEIKKVEADVAPAQAASVPEDQILLWRGIVELQRELYRMGRGEEPDFQRAETTLNDALRIKPTNTSLLLWRGTLRYHQGRFAEALADFDQRIRLSGAWPEVLLRRGRTCFKAGDLAAAETDFSRALERDRTLAEAWAGRGRARLQRGAFAEAADDLQRALDLDPSLDGEIRGDLPRAKARSR